MLDLEERESTKEKKEKDTPTLKKLKKNTTNFAVNTEKLKTKRNMKNMLN